MSEIEKRLGKLAEEINAEHRAFTEGLRTTLERGIRCGELLHQAKGELKHGEFGPWLKANFEASIITAQDYMHLHNRRDEIRAKARQVAGLGVGAALRELRSADREHPFFEVLEWVRFATSKRQDEAEIDAVLTDRMEHDFWMGVEDPLKITYLEQQSSTIRVHLMRRERAMEMMCGECMQGLEHVEDMWFSDEVDSLGRDGKCEARGWLRDVMISLSHTWVAGFGDGYKCALEFARLRLLSANLSEDFTAGVEARYRHTERDITIDLTEQERAVLLALFPDEVKAVDEAWEEDKDYELAMRKLETFTRPADIPPSQDQGRLKEVLSEGQMQMTFSELREAGVL